MDGENGQKKKSETICEIIRHHFSDPNETWPIYRDYPSTPPEDEIRQRIKLNLWREQKRREAKRRIPPCFKHGEEIVRILQQCFEFRYVILTSHYFEAYNHCLCDLYLPYRSRLNKYGYIETYQYIENR